MENFKNSETKINLMRAFAGESQARNRYTFAAETAKKQSLYVIEAVFKFTANQELAHADVFYKYLSELSGQNIPADGTYPLDISNSVVDLLKFAAHNEFEEHDAVYQSFAQKAKDEGFLQISASFSNIAEIEKAHGMRFKKLAEQLEQNKLFVSDVECEWMCLNCGYIFKGKTAPENCPVCSHEKGYFIRLELAPFTN